MASIKISGLDEFERDLKQLQQNADRLARGVPIQQVFNRRFMKRYTQYESIDDFFVAAGGKLNAEAGSYRFEDDVDLDAFVAQNSDFDDYDEMQAAAIEQML